jgi:Holliday junction resolvase RusA-like endonuclease
MIQERIKIKPLSINEAFQGRRFKTEKCKAYEKQLLLMLKKKSVPTNGMLRVEFMFGFSSSGSDLDNPVKVLIDVFQKKYGFNDNQIFEMNIRKIIVPKGSEFIEFGIFKLLPF